MPRKTDGDKIDELQKSVSVLEAKAEFNARIVTDIENDQRTLLQSLNDVRRELERDIAVLKSSIDELRRWTEKNGISESKAEITLLKDKTAKLEAAVERMGNRTWSVVPNIVGALITGSIAALVAFFVARR